MDARRSSDRMRRSWFRSDRLFRHGDQWFFYTREGTIEGPFHGQSDADTQIRHYIEAKTATQAGELSLQPRR